MVSRECKGLPDAALVEFSVTQNAIGALLVVSEELCCKGYSGGNSCAMPQMISASAFVMPDFGQPTPGLRCLKI